MAGLKHGPKGNPFPAKVLQRPVLNVLQGKITVVVMILLLHALHGFLLAGLDARKQGEGVQGRILRRGQHILNPFVGFATHVDEQITGGNAGNVRGGGLIAVQIHAAVQQQGQLYAGLLLTQNCTRPVVLRKSGTHDLQGAVAFCQACAGKKERVQAGQHHQKQLFQHIIHLVMLFLGMGNQGADMIKAGTRNNGRHCSQPRSNGKTAWKFPAGQMISQLESFTFRLTSVTKKPLKRFARSRHRAA